MLASSDLDVVDAAGIVKQRLDILGRNATAETILESCRAAAARRAASELSTTTEAAVNAFIASREGLRERSITAYDIALRPLRKNHGNRQIAELTSEDIMSACRLTVPGASAANRWRCVKAFIHYAAKRDWCNADWLVKVDPPRSNSKGKTEVLTPDEASALLAAAVTHYPHSVAYYALALFAGIRAQELAKLQPEDFSPDGISIPADTSKKSRRRHIEPNPTLKLWLEAFLFTRFADWENIDKTVRRLAGWDVASPILKEPPPATRGKWKQNALRHSYASYAVAYGISLEKLLFEFGHTGSSPTLLREHYLGLVTKAEAVKFFAILPPGADALPLLSAVV